MGIEKLQYLIEIEKAGSISKAAEALYISQPALSKSIASIEKSLGCKIFERTPFGLKATPEGQRYLAYAHQAVDLRRQTLEDIKQLVKERSSKKRFILGISQMRSIATLSRSLLNLFNTELDIELCAQVASDTELEQRVISGELDMAVITIPLDCKIDPALYIHPLVSERLLLAISTRNPILEKSEILSEEDFPYLSPAHLQDQRFILPSEGNRLRDMIDVFLVAEGITPTVTIYEDFVEFAHAEAAKGLGICFVNERLANADHQEALCYCQTNRTLPLRNVCAIWRKHNQSNADQMLIYRLICDEWEDIGWCADDIRKDFFTCD